MKRLIFGSLLSISLFSMAEDIELYVGTNAQRTGGNAKVLIIFDNSGSMASNTLSAKVPYNPEIVYDRIGDLNNSGKPALYFTKGVGIDNTIPVPDGPNERRRFLKEINGCDHSKAILADIGFFTGYFREYTFQGQSGSWQEIPDNNGLNIEVLDCLSDITSVNNKNATNREEGFPSDALGNKKQPDYYTEHAHQSDTHFGEGQLVTIYTENYLRWAQANADDIGVSEQTRLAIAQNTISDFIISNPNVDFGLQVFNVNAENENEKDGGRVVFGIQVMTESSKAEILDIIKNQIDGETNTPLCETLYEASQYFGGKAVFYGDDDSAYDGYVPNTPPRDQSIEDGAHYKTPFSDCTKEVYTILITDGEPTQDNAADNLVSALNDTGSPFDVNGTDNYLAELAGWMHHHDLITGEAAKLTTTGEKNFTSIRNATLNTIGFGFVNPDDVEDYVEPDAVKLLKDAANKGGGDYYAATDPAGLKESLDAVIFEISKSHGSFTAPAVATNNFDRTNTLDSVYYAMFQPDRGPRWGGNIKKLKVTINGIEDQNKVLALESNGNIKETATTFWTAGAADGNKVSAGGVAQMLRTKTDRVFLSDVKLDNGKLLPLNQENALHTYLTTALLADELNVEDDDEHLNIDNMLAWAKGLNVDQVEVSNKIPTIRNDVFGDPLHSKPLAINYASTSGSEDIRLIVGTNAGVLHMFSDSGNSVDEAWAFMPKEFLKNISALRDNYPSSEKIYGIDGSATVYISDIDGDGAIDEGIDKVWLFFGLRRGGNSYYALDISYKDSPKLMWHKSFEGAGQSWSQPKVAYSKINVSGTAVKPVLIFGAGYSTAKDNIGVGGNDLLGRGVFMVDAQSGNLIWRLSPDDDLSSITTNYAGTDSIPSKVAILDSDSDGFVDRVYTGDTGGNVWRVDMPGADISAWTAVKLASLGSELINEDDRRFFTQPTIVRALITETVTSTVQTEQLDIDGNPLVDGNGERVYDDVITIDRYDKPYDALLIGSGDLANPIGTDTNDKFFMIKDELIISQSLTGDLIPDVIQITDLKDYTLNPFQGIQGEALLTEQLDASSKLGWLINLNTSPGEKNTSPALVISGVVYLSTYTPAVPAETEEVCSAQIGGSALYAVGLALGINIYNWRRTETTGHITDSITFYIPKPVMIEGEKTPPATINLIIPDVFKITGCKDSECTETADPTVKTMRTYLYTEENY